ncbi:MAG: ribosome maturation factor RimP [Roseovarius sp.]|nr:ribosome maturation factor RimP [Roseovarius sp.]
MKSDLVAISPMDRRLAEIVSPVINDMGYELVRVRLMAENPAVLQIMAEKPEGGIDVDDCARISTALNVILDVEDPISDSYVLEVSSPGMDRPLTRMKDFELYEGYEAKLETRELIDGRKRFKGVLAGVEAGEILVNVDEGTIGLEYAWLANAKLVLNDELVGNTLKSRRNPKMLSENPYDDIETSGCEEK